MNLLTVLVGREVVDLATFDDSKIRKKVLKGMTARSLVFCCRRLMQGKDVIWNTN